MGEPIGTPDRQRRSPAWRRYIRFWGNDPARDLDDELRFHLAARIDDYLAQGMTLEGARLEAERRFGAVERVREQCATIDSQWTRERSMMETVLRIAADLRYATRQLRRNVSLSAAAILCLALGIGANTAIFTVVNAVLYRPLPFRDPSRLVLVGEGLPRFGNDNFGVISLPEYRDYQRLEGRTFAGVAIYETKAFAIGGDGAGPERVDALRMSANLLSVLGASPARGRAFTTADTDTSAASVAMIGNALWHRRFNADPGVIGRRIDVEGQPATIVGVMAPGFQFPLPGAGGQPADLFVPIKLTAAAERIRGNAYGTYLIARLANGVTLASAKRAVSSLAASLPTLHPDLYPGNWLTVADAFPLRDHAVKDVRKPLLILLAAVGLVLLIACINVSSLLLARAAAREREIAVRQALGASFGRLVQQFLAEGAVLVVVGTTCGVIVAVWLARLLATHAPSDVLHGYAVSLDTRVLGATAAIAILTSIGFSLVPALGVRRRSLAPSLHEGARGSTAGGMHQRGRRALVAAQISLALLLSTAAGLMVRSFLQARNVDPGFDPQHAITFRLGLPIGRYATGESIVQIEQRTIEALRQIPGVRVPSASSELPLGKADGDMERFVFTVEGQTPPQFPIAAQEIVYPDYFTAMGIRLREGRALSGSDVRNSLQAVIVNETLARQYFGTHSAIGHRLKTGGPQSDAPWLTIVGVAADVKQRGVDLPSDPELYVPAAQQSSNVALNFLRAPVFVLRTFGDPGPIMTAVQRTIRQIDPEVPIVGLQQMTNVIDVSMYSRYFNTLLLAGFALLALALASIGIYGLIAYSVVQRTREIGVRLAIGAMPHEIVNLVLQQGARVAAVGVVIGLAGSLLLTRFLRSLLFGVSPFDAPSFGGAALVLLIVAVLASYLPAQRAARIDPQAAIRAE